MKLVSILGTPYTIEIKKKSEDSFLNDCDGYCDKSTHRIVVSDREDDCELGDFETYQRKILRHEIIHAFHYESGLQENFECKPYGFPETLVDWFAIQFPKIMKVFEEVGCLE